MAGYKNMTEEQKAELERRHMEWQINKARIDARKRLKIAERTNRIANVALGFSIAGAGLALITFVNHLERKANENQTED